MDNAKLISTLSALTSESQNPETMDIDLLSSLDIVKKINQQDHIVSQAIEKILPQVALAVDAIVDAFHSGGRLIYLGAGTSGRLGILDAVECVPTFGVDADMVIGVMAGGKEAMYVAQEGVEDSQLAAASDLKKIALSDKDVIVGIAASGRTPYVIGGLAYARDIGACCVALSSNQNAEIVNYADISLLPQVGPEPLTGSTRMKSGTAQKMLLNMLSTASMIRIGKSYQNLMVDLRATNEKLFARGAKMVMQITGVEQATAERALELSGNQVKLAILMLLTELDRHSAELLLEKNAGFLRQALIEKNP